MPFRHGFPFDPTYGYDLDALLAVEPPDNEPDDFDRFWRDTYREAIAVAPRVATREIESPEPGCRLYEVDFDAWGDRRVGGWLVLPRDTPPRLGLIQTHGYGGIDTPLPLPDLPVPATVLMLCFRGFGRSRFDDLPDTAARHVLHGIADRDTYLHRGCIADVWAAASALLELAPAVTGRLVYAGGSFGGGLGPPAVAWDPRFTRAFFDKPSFGHYPLRVTLPSNGSNAAVSAYHRRHPEVLDTLRYYDAAFHARRITIPTLVAPAKFDPAVPPPGQFVVYNALRGDRQLFVRE